jgi:membrane-bound ClpP family serine protease
MNVGVNRCRRLAKFGVLLGFTRALPFLFLAANKLAAAEISQQQLGSSSVELILLNGVIEPEDTSTFLSAIAAHEKGVVVLNSEGGAVLPALEMGKRLRIKQLATAVPENALCASACALMWLAGSPRLMAEGAKIGFHAAYIRKNGALLESGTGNALIGAYPNILSSEPPLTRTAHPYRSAAANARRRRRRRGRSWSGA